MLFVLAVALVLSSTLRSRIGALAGLAVFAALTLARLPDSERLRQWDRGRLARSGAALAGGLIVLVAVAGFSNRMASTRAATQVERQQYRERQTRAAGALKALGRRPLLGLGLGGYPLQQQALTGLGRPMQEVAQTGPSLEDQAQNEYLQIGAELGLPGLLLYLLLLMLFFARSVHALDRLSAGRARLLLIGCIAAITAQCVDAAGNPAWRYSVCSLYFWLLLGLGAALAQMATAVPASVLETGGAEPSDRSASAVVA